MSMSPEPEEECLPASCTAAARASRDRRARRESRARTEPSRRNPRAARSAKNLFDRDAMAHNLNAVDGCRSYLTLFGAVGAGVVGVCVEIKFTALHAIDATPARWRGDVGSSPLDGASTAASSPRNDLVKNYRVHPTHWLISTQQST